MEEVASNKLDNTLLNWKNLGVSFEACEKSNVCGLHGLTARDRSDGWNKVFSNLQWIVLAVSKKLETTTTTKNLLKQEDENPGSH